jgi:glycerol-3-phosphate acyltransferase PlsY
MTAVELAAFLTVALVAYLFGSIPTGFLVAKAKGVDIRTVGSGNIGATNVFRVLGKGAGILVLLVDALKGWVAVRLCALWIADLLLPPDSLGGSREIAAIVAAVFAVLGHNYTCWLHFKGGKGIATSAGVIAGLVPWALLIILGVWIVLFAATHYVSVGSIGAAFALPFATWFTTKNLVLTVVTGTMGALAIYKHRGNIQRLLNGTENRISFKKKEPRP